MVDQVDHWYYPGCIEDWVPLNEAKTRLSELIRRVEGGEEIVIRRGPTPVARLIREPNGRVLPPGSVPGISGRLAADFDQPLEDFAEYLDDAVGTGPDDTPYLHFVVSASDPDPQLGTWSREAVFALRSRVAELAAQVPTELPQIAVDVHPARIDDAGGGAADQDASLARDLDVAQ